MRKSLLCILVICIFLLVGCTNAPSKTADDSQPIVAVRNNPIPVETQSEPTDDSWKYELAERLYREMCYFYDNMEEHEIIQKAKTTHKFVNRNEVGYNCVMAIDRGIGIAQVYYKYLSEEKVNDVIEKMYDLDYVQGFAGVQFGYAEDGMHFIAIYPQKSEYGTVADSVKNEMRNSDDEMDFLYEFCDRTDYFLVDVFAEDLSKTTDNVCMNVDFVDYNQPYIIDSYGVDEISKGAHILEKYGRSYVSESSPTKTSSWNLYAFEKQSIDDSIIVVNSKEIVKLYNGIPVNNLF